MSTLLWLLAAMAAFFVGRQSDEISARLTQFWQTVRTSSSSNPIAKPTYRFAHQPDGSVLFTSDFKIASSQIYGPSICGVDGLGTKEVRIFARQDGNTKYTVWQYDQATGETHFVTLDLVITGGRITATPVPTPPGFK